MAMAAANCWFSVLNSSTGPTSRCSLTSHCPFSNSGRSTYFVTSVVKSSMNQNKNRKSCKRLARKLPGKFGAESEAIRQNFPGRSRNEISLSNANGLSNRKKAGRSQSISFRSSGVQRQGNKEVLFESRNQQVETGNLQDDAYLSAVVKVYCTHSVPDYSLPWQRKRHYQSSGSAFMIADGKLLTNAHCVKHGTQVQVKKRGDDTKYVAEVLAKGIECDIALLSVEDKEFWKGAQPLQFGHLPNLQDAVTVVGYPLGGDTISVTKGVVSRIEVTSFGSSELLTIQIDAAMNRGNSGGPALNDQGECIGVAFRVYRSHNAENIGYVIPSTVIFHFLEDYEKNGRYTGFPSLGVLLQKLENPDLRACLKVPSNEGILVRRVEPTSDASNVLKKGDVIVSFDGVRVGCEGTVPFQTNERIAFRYLISQKFSGDVAELGIIRAGKYMKVQVTLNPRLHLVPHHIEGDKPSYLIVGGLVFTPLSEPFIEAEDESTIGLKLLTKARCSMSRFKGEQIVILSEVLSDDVNIGYEELSNEQVLKLNGTWIRNIHHLAHLIDSCKYKYLVFELEDSFLVVLERETAIVASGRIIKENGIPLERSSVLLEPYVDSIEHVNAMDQSKSTVDCTVHESELRNDGLLWILFSRRDCRHAWGAAVLSSSCTI